MNFRRFHGKAAWNICLTAFWRAVVFGLFGPLVGLGLLTVSMGTVSVIDAIHVQGKWPVGEFLRGMPQILDLLPAAYRWGLVPALACGLVIGTAESSGVWISRARLFLYASFATLVGAAATAMWLVAQGMPKLGFLVVMGAGAAGVVAVMWKSIQRSSRLRTV